ncbi:hypothetical protein FHS29_000895 [Saccharothrix tamanrassetensis]|uniref:Uncharacterized protein n=1 Tax=Saccharothrix tamanrassetensis TaxID=1051531 RepID=A0A841CE75_9PSEU|nr:hypothetical protein [Saccharothrix tamanrassetensis]
MSNTRFATELAGIVFVPIRGVRTGPEYHNRTGFGIAPDGAGPGSSASAPTR